MMRSSPLSTLILMSPSEARVSHGSRLGLRPLFTMRSENSRLRGNERMAGVR
jgi:hypothetical protein